MLTLLLLPWYPPSCALSKVLWSQHCRLIGLAAADLAVLIRQGPTCAAGVSAGAEVAGSRLARVCCVCTAGVGRRQKREGAIAVLSRAWPCLSGCVTRRGANRPNRDSWENITQGFRLSPVQVPINIWELGLRLLLSQPAYVLAYIDFLIGAHLSCPCSIAAGTDHPAAAAPQRRWAIDAAYRKFPMVLLPRPQSSLTHQLALRQAPATWTMRGPSLSER